MTLRSTTWTPWELAMLDLCIALAERACTSVVIAGVPHSVDAAKHIRDCLRETHGQTDTVSERPQLERA